MWDQYLQHSPTVIDLARPHHLPDLASDVATLYDINFDPQGSKSGLQTSWINPSPSMTTPGFAGPFSSSNGPQQPRQIRFVSNDGQPHAKRRRINAACRTCRKRKTRCSGERPTCETCRQNGHECLGYAEQSQSQNSPTMKHEDGEEEDLQSNQSDRLSPGKTGSYPAADRRKRLSESSASVAGTPKLKDSNTISKTSHAVETPEIGTITSSNRFEENSSPRPTGHEAAQGTAYRVPFFRYFGPTAIVPGFKQMVVQVKEQRRSMGAQPMSAANSPAPSFTQNAGGMIKRSGSTTSSQTAADFAAPAELPHYDPNDSTPNHPLITHLIELFFLHLGSNFPFLQHERFPADVEAKRVDRILVNAACALAARFSSHPLLTASTSQDLSNGTDADGIAMVPENGQAFAQRAKASLIETFSCPKVSIVQACLLLAYQEFGSNRDSGLWMYLGIAIRMAQDLGMQKLEGIKFEGRAGPTPKTVKHGGADKHEDTKRRPKQEGSGTLDKRIDITEEQKLVERQRVDTFWAIFFADRVICSGTGRPVTLRDKDVELSFPSLDEVDPHEGWPVPFPSLIRIIHLYGRVTDLLNNIKEVNHVSPETLKRLAGMETDLTGIYQRLSPKLHFNVANFQHFVKLQQGTNFILLHVWFHALIVLMHQPTLLHSLHGRIQQLSPNSRELSMSSAKTIADILAFAELIDAKSFTSTPFSSQPIYIAACAFLMESVVYASSTSTSPDTTSPQTPAPLRSSSAQPLQNIKTNAQQPIPRRPSIKTSASQSTSSIPVLPDQHASKNTQLAAAANSNYQRCYKALKSLERYWAGTKYIITVLDQKAKGIVDPLLYTAEEMESALELPQPKPAFTSPSWRKSSVQRPTSVRGGSPRNNPKYQPGGYSHHPKGPQESMPANMVDPSQAIGWSLTGTTNSPNSNLTFLYQSNTGETGTIASETQVHNSAQENHQLPFNSHLQHLPLDTSAASTPPTPDMRSSSMPFSPLGGPTLGPSPTHELAQQFHPHHQHLSHQHLGITQHPHHPPVPKFSHGHSDPTPTSEAEMLLGLNSPYSTTSNPAVSPLHPMGHAYDATQAQLPATPSPRNVYDYPLHPMDPNANISMTGTQTMGPSQDMIIEYQDVNVSAVGGDMASWLGYLPPTFMNMSDPNNNGGQVPPSLQYPGAGALQFGQSGPLLPPGHPAAGPHQGGAPPR